MAFYQAWYPILNSKTAFFNIKKSLYSLGMIINLVLFFIPKRQEIYRLYLIKKRKKLAYMMLNSKRLCLQQIYGEGKYKDCNDLPIGESAIAFSSALNKPDANMYFIFCIGSMRDKIKIQYAMRYALVWNVRIRIYDFNDGTWSNWH